MVRAPVSVSVHGTLTQEDYSHVAEMVGEDWKEMGQALGLQLGVLDGIGKQKSDDVDRCELVFKTWLKRGKRDDKVSFIPSI